MIGLIDRYCSVYIEIQAQVRSGIKTKQDALVGLQLDGSYTKPTHDNDNTYYYNDDHNNNNNCNNNNKKEIKKKQGIGARAVCILCDKQVLLDSNITFLPVWSSVNNTKQITSNLSVLTRKQVVTPLLQHSKYLKQTNL